MIARRQTGPLIVATGKVNNRTTRVPWEPPGQGVAGISGFLNGIGTLRVFATPTHLLPVQPLLGLLAVCDLVSLVVQVARDVGEADGHGLGIHAAVEPVLPVGCDE